MDQDLRYAHEKLWATVDSLAAGIGTIHERLVNGYIHQGGLRVPAVDGGDYDDQLADDIKRLHADMTSSKAVGFEGDVGATVNAMTDDEARHMAERILELARRVETLYWIARGAKA